MAVRIRKDGTIVCAAKSQPEDGDGYIDDGLHYILSVGLKVLSVIGHDNFRAELWQFHKAEDKQVEVIQALLESGHTIHNCRCLACGCKQQIILAPNLQLEMVECHECGKKLSKVEHEI